MSRPAPARSRAWPPPPACHGWRRSRASCRTRRRRCAGRRSRARRRGTRRARRATRLALAERGFLRDGALECLEARAQSLIVGTQGCELASELQRRNRVGGIRGERDGPLGPERLGDGKQEERQEDQLREDCLPRGIQAERFDVGKAGDERDRDGVALLKLAHALADEDECHVVQQYTRDAEERSERDTDAVPIEQREDHRERGEANENAEADRERDPRALVEERLVEERRLRALAVHGEESHESERLASPVLQRTVDLLADELLPLGRFDTRDEPV